MNRICSLSMVAVFVIAGAAPSLLAKPPAAKPLATLQSVTVNSTAAGITVEIAASQPVALRSQVIADPDRLILDFSNSVPAGDLRTKLLNQGEMKGYRVARYSANPPVTRIVLDLNSPQHYQIFPDGKTVIVKLMSDQQQAAVQAHLENAAYTPVPAKPVSRVDVQYQNGRLSIHAEGASLSEVLNEVHRRTGTDIAIPPGAAQEPIVVGVPMLPIREALSSLLNGSRYNFIMVDSEREPGKLKSVILSFRGAGGISQPAIAVPEPPVTDATPEPEPPEEPMQQEMQAPAQEGGAARSDVPPAPDTPPPQHQ